MGLPAIGGSTAASLSHRRLHDRSLAGDEISLLLHRLALCSRHDLAENKVTSANKRLVRFRSFSQRNVYLPADLQARVRIGVGKHACSIPALCSLT
jgi:hypothetical protein